MLKVTRALALALLMAAVLAGCKRERGEATEPEGFHFTVYPGARYLQQLTDLAKQAHNIGQPNEPAPPTAFYDTDAPLEAVANFYAKSYGYAQVAPDSTNDLSAARPQAYYRSGDLAKDVKSIESVLQKLKLNVDISKAQGNYRAVEIQSRPNRPRVTIQRPYFDVTKSQVVDRTIILMAP